MQYAPSKDDKPNSTPSDKLSGAPGNTPVNPLNNPPQNIMDNSLDTSANETSKNSAVVGKANLTANDGVKSTEDEKSKTMSAYKTSDTTGVDRH